MEIDVKLVNKDKMPERGSTYVDTPVDETQDARYIIIDRNTKKVIDNANGYGYKTHDKACASYRYLYANEKVKARNDICLKWLKGNKILLDEIMRAEYLSVKNENKPLGSIMVKEIMDNLSIKTDWSAKDVFHAYKKLKQ